MFASFRYTVYFVLTDHLGSTTLTTQPDGTPISELRYTAYGEERYTSGETPTGYRYTGQLSKMDTTGLYYYGARWYDPGIMAFASADTLIPDPYNPLDWNRYMYVRANPVRYNDPTGHYACGDGYEDQCLIEQEQASYQIAKAGLKPEAGCSSGPLCSDSYKTFIQVTMALGRVPTMSEILMMTAATEYFGVLAAESTGQEGLARNFYEFCDTDGYFGGEIYKFFSGFQPWYGRPYVKGDGSPSARTGHLINRGLHNRRGEQLKDHADDILNSNTAKYRGWIFGKEPNEPWQWFGPFLLDPSKNPTFGYDPNNAALLNVDFGNGYVFWMFTGAQDRNFNLDYWRVK